MSRFIDTIVAMSAKSPNGLTTGEPHEPVRRTWAEIHRKARAGAAELVAGGLQPGDSVAILAADVAQVAHTVQSVWLAGGSTTMLHEPGHRANPAAWQAATLQALRTVHADLVLLGRPYESFAEVLRAHGFAARAIDETERPGAGEAFVPVEVGEDAPALLQLTSGSTAEPKAVRVTHGNVMANLEDFSAARGFGRPDDVMVSWVPMFHDMGLVGCFLGSLTTGMEYVAITPAEFLGYPGLWQELMHKYRGTMTAAPNFSYVLMARQLAATEPGSLDLSCVRIMGNGGEPIDPDAMHRLMAAGAPFGLAPETLACVYGAAENGVLITITPEGERMVVDVVDAAALEKNRRAVPAAADAAPGEVRRFPLLGYVLPSVSARIVGDKGEVLGEREVGTIQLRGASVAAAYSTEAGIVPATDADGWLDMGDEGYFVGDRLVVCGRRKDIIIVGGRNIFPTDIERAATGADGVRAGNVIAVRVAADGVGGIEKESFAVLVESRQHDDPAAAERIRDAVAARVLSDVGVRPARVLVLPPATLPKTSSGKLRRAAARDLL
ncbi:long-chain-fatty-acid--CoA ligase [Yinghuangia soli]|uniref:AMP-binding protein n=1 Tax=Yinghuangia soli TaxID=2908204 RepID=A0AA41Q0A4_9ACTN|nr:long-chain-fatty-acid--CoA ligase [Yinghuangia soli]MCF2528862.1 AMP-binding protein [Yinghuangia soli]